MEGILHVMETNLQIEIHSREFRLQKTIKIDLNQAIGITQEVGVKTLELSRKKPLRKRRIQSIMVLIRLSAIRIP